MRPTPKPSAMPRPPLVGVGARCRWRASAATASGPAAIRMRQAIMLTTAEIAAPPIKSRITRHLAQPG
jgi:hypothetical protein